jgi:hypothetical protein
MKSYFHKRGSVKIRVKKCGKKTHIAIGCKRGRLVWGADHVKGIRKKIF